ncbi:MAG: MarR family transcriptional regulator [Chloroflexota bacterium]
MDFDFEYDDSLAALRALAEVRHRIWAALDRELQTREKISMTWFEVLGSLLQNDEGALPMHELASSLLSSPSGMTRLVDRIERAGLVRRTAHPSDRRVTLVTITEPGRALVERVMPEIKRVAVEGFASRLSAKQARDLRSILEQLLQDTGGIDSDETRAVEDGPTKRRKFARSPRAAVRS